MTQRQQPTVARDQATAPALSWAVREFATLDLGDPRRVARAIDLAETLGQQPTASLPEACRDAAQLEAAYRFFANDGVEAQALLAAHRAATVVRMAAEPVVLAVNDTTSLDYSHHTATTGLGPLRSAQQQGELVHGTLAVTPAGLSLGLLDVAVWVRDAATYAQLPDRHQRRLTEKESHVWLDSLTAACAARHQCPATHVIAVGDREADVYDLFAAHRPAGLDLLVRARHDRAVAGGGRLRATVARAPVLATTTLVLRARPGVAARTATLEVRACAVTLLPPGRRAAEQLPAVAVWVVWAHEPHPPAGVTPLDWLLLTTVPTATAEAALARVGWYRCRWLIELWHKVLKSGCALEDRQLQTQARLGRLLALYGVIAWRVLYATALARTAPDLPCTVLLSALEWRALWCRIQGRTPPPATPPALHEAVRWVAQLGGFLGRKGDGEPGMVVLWRGLHHLADATAMYAIMQPSSPPEPL